MRTIIWRLTPGGKIGQEGLEAKKQEGLAYIERLKQEGETVMSVEERQNDIKIVLADAEDIIVEPVQETPEIVEEVVTEPVVEPIVETPSEPIIPTE